MAFNFPSNPSLNDSYSFNGKTWVFNGNAWIQSRIGGNDITTTGNISANVVTANIFIGDGSQLTGLPASYSDSNVATYLTTYDGNIAAGNILSDNYFYANGEPFVSSNYGNTDVENLLSGNITVGNISITGTIDGYATTTYVDNEVANLVASAPSTLDTLNELAAALGDDANFSTTVANSIGSIGANVSVLQGNIVTLETNITSLEANIPANLQTNVTTLESDVSTLQGNVSTIESNIVTLQNDVVAIDNQVANLNYYDDSNVTTFLSDIGSNNISTTGDITANAFIGDGSQLTGLPAGYTDSNVTALLSNFGNNAIETTGNISAEYFIGNGSQLTGIDTSGSTVTTGNVVPSSPNDGDVWFNTDSGKQFVYINDGDSSQWVETQAHTSLSLGGGDVDLSAVDQNIVPSANLVYDLGSSTNRWRDIYLANSTIYLGEANISAQGGALTLPSTVSIGNSVLDASSGNLALPSTVSIGNVTIDASSGNLSLPEGSSIGGATVATPRIASIDYGDDDTAANIAGGQTIGIVGSGFSSGAQVLLDGSSVGVVTVVNSNRIEITAPAKSTGSYSLYVINSDGATGIYIPGIQYSGVPAWSSPSAGSLGSVYETGNISQTFSANSDSNVSYSLYSGNLPTGTTLDANTGVLSGTANLIVGSSVTYNFTIRATDEENQDTDRAFSLTVEADSVTWSSPTDGDTLSLIANTSSSTTLVASSAAGDTIDYTANTLPNGLSLSGNIISGTPTSIANTSVALTATANTTTRSSTVTVTFVVALPLGDEYFNLTTLLLNGDDNTFITDASDNAFTITPNGDTSPSAFSPYNTSWSNYFDGNGDSLTIGSSSEFTFGTGDWTVEYWVYLPAWTGLNTLLNISNSSNPDTPYGFVFRSTGTVGQWQIYIGDGANWTVSGAVTSTSPGAGVWQHHAHVRSSGTYTMYIDGVSRYSVANSADLPYTYAHIGRYVYFATGYISNFRVVKGTAVYTANFTPPTAPLTDISGTSLLTCQSNRLIDNSTNNFAITRNGDVKVTSFAPFTETDTSTGSGYFDGTGDYLTAPIASSSMSSSTSFTIEFWAYWGVLPASYSMFLSDSNGNLSKYIAYNAGAGTLDVQTGGSGPTVAYASFSPVVNTWYHLAFVRNGTTITIYVNGSALSMVQPTQANSFLDTGSTTYIGRWAGTTPYEMNGYISNLRIVKGTAVYTSNFTPPTAPLTAVSGTSLLTLQSRISYNNSQPIDESGIRNIITRNGNAAAGTFSPHVPTGWSAYFDGANDYFTVGSAADWTFLHNGSSWTIEFDIYHSSTSLIVLLSTASATTERGISIQLNSAVANDVGVGVFRGASGSFAYFTSTANLVTNQWNHVGVTFDTSTKTCTFYINGVQSGSSSDAGFAYSASIPANTLVVGLEEGSLLHDYVGYLSNLRISNVVRTGMAIVPSAPYTSDADTKLLTLRGPSFTDDGPNRFAITRNGDTKITPFSPFKTHTITPDSYSVYFDGTGDYLSIAYSPVFLMGSSTDFTIEGWVNPSVSPADASAIYSSYDGATAGNWIVWFQSGKLGLYQFNDSNFTTGAFQSTTTIPVGSWTHFAITRSGTVFRLFINGVQEDTFTGSVTFGVANKAVEIGRYAAGASSYFNGHISNLRHVVGTALYTADFDDNLPTSPLTDISGTSLLACQSPTIIDNSTNDFAITVNGNSQPTKFNPFGETVTSNVEYTPAAHGGSVYFDGTGDYLSVADNDAFEFGSGDFTIEGWIYTNTVAAGLASIITKSNGTSVAAGPFLIGRNGSSIIVRMSSNGSSWDIVNAVSFGTLVVGQWMHFALVRNGTSFVGYLNGVGTTVATSAASLVNNTNNLLIASIFTSAGYIEYWNGYISNVRLVKGTALYTSAFVPPQAPVDPIAGSTLLINGTNAAIQDKTGRDVVETVGNATLISESPYSLNKSVYFDGTGDYLGITDSVEWQISTDYTIEAWVYPTGGAGTFRGLLGQAADGGNYWLLGIDASNQLSFNEYTGGGYVIPVTSAGTVSLNQWSHVALVVNGTTVTCYVNGIAGTPTTKSGTSGNYAQTLKIASNGLGTGSYFTGYISNARIVKGTAVYTSNFTPPTAPLTAITNTSLLACQSYNFKDNSTNNFTVTAIGNTKISSRGPFTETTTHVSSMKFDGTGDCLVVPRTPELTLGGSDFTIECWVYTAGNATQTIYSSRIGNTYNGWLFAIMAGNYLGIVADDNGSAPWAIDNTASNSGSQVPLNQWVHIALSREGSAWRTFINGTLNYTVTSSISIYEVDASVTIGADQKGASSNFNGYIDDLRITKGIARYTANFTPPTTSHILK